MPFSKPGLPRSWVAEADEIVRLIEVVWVSVPEVPVMVTVVVPVVAVLLAVKVRVLEEVVGFVPNVAVTPEGRAEVDRLTLPVKPFRSVTVIVLLPLVPCLTVRLVGEADSEKSGAAGAFTVRVTVVVWVSVPDVPVMVTVAVPVVAVLLAVKVRTLVEVVGLVPKLAVTPEGRPEADSDTLPVKPFSGVTVIVLLPLLPCVTVRLVGEAESEKSGVAAPPQPENLKLAMRVFQLNEPVVFRYSVVYQNVQSSTGSTVMAL